MEYVARKQTRVYHFELEGVSRKYDFDVKFMHDGGKWNFVECRYHIINTYDEQDWEALAKMAEQIRRLKDELKAEVQ